MFFFSPLLFKVNTTSTKTALQIHNVEENLFVSQIQTLLATQPVEVVKMNNNAKIYSSCGAVTLMETKKYALENTF
jgi:ABC-type taurine transport system ATPase subunit